MSAILQDLRYAVRMLFRSPVALGARPLDIARVVLRRGAALLAAGLGLGLLGAGVVSQLLSGSLYRVSAFDSATFLLVALLLSGVTIAACSIPARRAARVDPGRRSAQRMRRELR